MIINGFRNTVKQATFYIPFTLYFFLFVIAGSVAFRFLTQRNFDTHSSFADILNLLMQVALAFAILLLVLALVSVLVSVFYFLYKRKNGLISFNIATELSQGSMDDKQTVRLHLHPVLKPFLGFLKIRLQYDQAMFSNKFQLLEKKQNLFFNQTIEGTYHWPLPQIKEYHVQKAILYFEDYFQFFSVAVDLPANNLFYTHPGSLKMPDRNVRPRKTEETSTRIDELRKVEGEYLNYKNFENNDDVRRIVWKIYAKNKELVVRIPEIMDPYASHVYLYASFFSGFNIDGNSPAQVPFLNYYKTMIWTLYQDLVKKGFEVRYIPDQPLAKSGAEKQQVQYNVSTSSWHQNQDLVTYCKTKDASMLVISSLSDAHQVEQLLERHGNDIRFVFVRLTDSLKKQNILDWVQWLFVQNEKNDMEVYKTAWAASLTLRPRIVENEKKLQKLLQKYQAEVLA